MIKLQKQKFLHDPPNTWGDCHRTCVAMILGRGRDSIPHFYDNGVTMAEGDVVKDAFMKFNGLHEISINVGGEYDLNGVIAGACYCSELPYILGCSSPISNHSVVVDGVIIYNPSLTSDEIVGPMSDGKWWIEYLVKQPT